MNRADVHLDAARLVARTMLVVDAPKLAAKLVDWLGFPIQFQSSPSLVTNIWKKPVVFTLKLIQFNPFQF